MAKSKENINQQVIDLLAKHQADNDFTPEERALLRQFSGNGGTTAEKGTLNEFYTPPFVCEFMRSLAIKYLQTDRFFNLNVLEPSCAIGNMIDGFEDCKIDAFEINPISARICKILHPNVNVYQQYFETVFLAPHRFNSKLKAGQLTWLENAPYDVVIGNPPYGAAQNKYTPYFAGNNKFKQFEFFFIYHCLRLLKSGGVLVFIVPMNFISTGDTYQTYKERIFELADFVDAYRLPKVFESTPLSTDIIVFRKK